MFRMFSSAHDLTMNNTLGKKAKAKSKLKVRFN